MSRVELRGQVEPGIEPAPPWQGLRGKSLRALYSGLSHAVHRHQPGQQPKQKHKPKCVLAAQNLQAQQSANSSQSASVGVGIALGGQSNGITFNANLAAARGKANGQDSYYNNTHINAANKLDIQSGSDTTLKGAVVSGKQVAANIGGNLNIESLQDTSTFDSKQSNLSAGVTLCIPPICTGTSSASLSLGRSQANSDYASVSEQI